MPRYDRLSALMSRFTLSVSPSEVVGANLLIVGGQENPIELIYSTVGHDGTASDVLFSAVVQWGGSENPLIAALPAMISQPLCDDAELRALVQLLLAEQAAARCGSAGVLNRLCEVLIVRLMRQQIEAGTTQTGLLGGLADPRLSRAIVAMHDEPVKPWQVGSLATIAGLSASRFAELFKTAVGVPPLTYLRNWRLLLAKQDIEQGARIQSVARRYGYTSPEALSRAFSKNFGLSPMKVRRR